MKYKKYCLQLQFISGLHGMEQVPSCTSGKRAQRVNAIRSFLAWFMYTCRADIRTLNRLLITHANLTGPSYRPGTRIMKRKKKKNLLFLYQPGNTVQPSCFLLAHKTEPPEVQRFRNLSDCNLYDSDGCFQERCFLFFFLLGLSAEPKFT